MDFFQWGPTLFVDVDTGKVSKAPLVTQAPGYSAVAKVVDVDRENGVVTFDVELPETD